MGGFLRRIDNERGSALVITGVGLAALLGMSAFAVDMAMLYSARDQAQRAADAAALAGVGAYIDYQPVEARKFAREWALDYGTRNSIIGQTIRASEVAVTTDPDSLEVTVVVRRTGIRLWFARSLGVGSATVSARAKARAMDAASSPCLKPFALPDAWYDADDDKNGNNRIDQKERWRYEEEKGDFYRTFTGKPSALPETGYGSTFRGPNRDYGLELYTQVSETKPKKGKQSLFAWDLPELSWYTEPDDETEDDEKKSEKEADEADDEPLQIPVCQTSKKRKKSSRKLGADYEADICECNSAAVELNTEYPVVTAKKMRKPVRKSTKHGIYALIEADPGARWDAATNQVVGSKHPRWLDSPRVIKVGLYEPGSVEPKKRNRKFGAGSVEFVKFLWVFIDGWDKQDQLRIRVIRPVRIPRLAD